MYYEEKMIDGIMHYRTTPDGTFWPYDLKELSRRYEETKAEQQVQQGDPCPNSGQHDFQRANTPQGLS